MKRERYIKNVSLNIQQYIPTLRVILREISVPPSELLIWLILPSFIINSPISSWYKLKIGRTISGRSRKIRPSFSSYVNQLGQLWRVNSLRPFAYYYISIVRSIYANLLHFIRAVIINDSIKYHFDFRLRAALSKRPRVLIIYFDLNETFQKDLSCIQDIFIVRLTIFQF